MSLPKKKKKKASLIKSRTGKTLEGLWKKGAVWWGQGKQRCRCCNHGSISTKFLFSLLKIKAGLARGMAEEDRDMVYAIFSLRGLCWSPAFRRITEQCATGRKWASESQLYSRTQKLSFRVYIFKKQKSKKKDWNWKIPEEPKTLSYSL